MKDAGSRNAPPMPPVELTTEQRIETENRSSHKAVKTLGLVLFGVASMGIVLTLGGWFLFALASTIEPGGEIDPFESVIIIGCVGGAVISGIAAGIIGAVAPTNRNLMKVSWVLCLMGCALLATYGIAGFCLIWFPLMEGDAALALLYCVLPFPYFAALIPYAIAAGRYLKRLDDGQER